MGAFLRGLVGVVPVLTREQAIERARAHAESKGWPWAQPLHIEEGLTEIYSRTNAECRGRNVNIRVRRSDGTIISAAFAAR